MRGGVTGSSTTVGLFKTIALLVVLSSPVLAQEWEDISPPAVADHINGIFITPDDEQQSHLAMDPVHISTATERNSACLRLQLIP